MTAFDNGQYVDTVIYSIEMLGEQVLTVVGYRGIQWGVTTGYEYTISRNLRIAPFGNRTGPTIGQYPHYYRRVVNSTTGQTTAGQVTGRHRPLDTKSTDRSFWDRF